METTVMPSSATAALLATIGFRTGGEPGAGADGDVPGIRCLARRAALGASPGCHLVAPACRSARVTSGGLGRRWATFSFTQAAAVATDASTPGWSSNVLTVINLAVLPGRETVGHEARCPADQGNEFGLGPT
jgi:hypothetical protein